MSSLNRQRRFSLLSEMSFCLLLACRIDHKGEEDANEKRIKTSLRKWSEMAVEA